MRLTNPLFNRNFIGLSFLALIFITFSCKWNDKKKLYPSPFCDTCELEVISKVFKLDTVQIFYQDCSDVKNVKSAILPIENSYLKSINVSKYINDTTVLNHIDLNSIKDYELAVGNDSILSSGNFGIFSKALFSSTQIRGFTNGNKIGKYIRISKPIFGEGNNYALVEVDYCCNRLCGEGYTYLLKRNNNDWVLCKKIFRWVA